MLISAGVFASSVIVPETSIFILATLAERSQYVKIVLDTAIYKQYSYVYDPKQNLLPDQDTSIVTLACLDTKYLLSGSTLRLIDIAQMTIVKESKTSTNFKYVICIDSSTCIAADDSTTDYVGIYIVD